MIIWGFCFWDPGINSTVWVWKFPCVFTFVCPPIGSGSLLWPGGQGLLQVQQPGGSRSTEGVSRAQRHWAPLPLTQGVQSRRSWNEWGRWDHGEGESDSLGSENSQINGRDCCLITLSSWCIKYPTNSVSPLSLFSGLDNANRYVLVLWSLFPFEMPWLSES